MISVIVPSWNYGFFLDKAVRSLVHQTRPFDEVVIVDDCSDDDTAVLGPELVARFGPDQRMRYVRNTERRGIVWNLNHYLPKLRSEWVCMVSADDWVAPTFVEAHERSIVEHGHDWRAAIHYSGARYTVTHRPTDRPELDGLVIGLDPWDPDRLRVQNFVHGSAVIRRSVLTELGGFVDAEVEEDHATWRRFADAGFYGVSVPEVLLFYRQHHLGHRNYRTDERKRGGRPAARWA